jgi:hypothetical protein
MMKIPATFFLVIALYIGGFYVCSTAAEDVSSPVAAPTQPGDKPSKTNSRCTVQRDANGWWLVSRSGEKFFSLGVCMFNQGSKKDEYNPVKPSYAALRHYDGPEAWADASLRRLKSWGFTTVGGWSDYATLQQSREHDLWITPVLHLGSTSGAPWFDMWDEKVIRRIEEVAEKAILPLRDDPRVLGYFSDNELGWWNAIMWKMTLEQPATSGQRQRLIRLLHDEYEDDWLALTRDFEPDGAESWAALQDKGMLWLRPGSNGIHTMRRFLSLVANRYYGLMRDMIHKFDPGALYLGDRYQSFYYPEVPIASRPYVDVISTNLNVSWNDGTFIPSYLETLHKLTEKPVLVSEFYMAAEDNRSGNKNKVGGFPAVTTQIERGKALSNTLIALARLPYVVGADWFQYYDEPPHGRKLDGEDYNFGLVDIHDQPYTEVVNAFTSVDLHGLKSTTVATKTDAAMPIPPAPKNPLAHFDFMTALKSWDRDRGRVRPTSPHPMGDLYLCWSPTTLYIATYVLEIVEPDYYRDGAIPEMDRAAWNIQLDGGKPISAIVGAGMKPVISPADIEFKSLSGTYHDVRCITVVAVPAANLGKERFKSGDSISLDSSFVAHGRAYQTKWKGQFVLGD